MSSRQVGSGKDLLQPQGQPAGGRADMKELREGYLIKSPPLKDASNASIKAWKRRYFVVQSPPPPGEPTIKYFKDEASYKAGEKEKGEVRISSCVAVEPVQGKFRYSHLFVLKALSRNFFLSAPGKDEMDRWIFTFRNLLRDRFAQTFGLMTAGGMVVNGEGGNPILRSPQPTVPMAQAPLPPIPIAQSPLPPLPINAQPLPPLPGGASSASSSSAPSSGYVPPMGYAAPGGGPPAPIGAPPVRGAPPPSLARQNSNSTAQPPPPPAAQYQPPQQRAPYSHFQGADASPPKGLERAPQSFRKGAPENKDHLDKPWFYGNMFREDAEAELLRASSGSVSGMFLVRGSPRTPGEYALSWCQAGAISHTKIIQRHGTYKFDVKKGALMNMSANTLTNLIESPEFRDHLAKVEEANQLKSQSSQRSGGSSSGGGRGSGGSGGSGAGGSSGGAKPGNQPRTAEEELELHGLEPSVIEKLRMSLLRGAKLEKPPEEEDAYTFKQPKNQAVIAEDFPADDGNDSSSSEEGYDDGFDDLLVAQGKTAPAEDDD